MARPLKPWYWKARDAWCVDLAGKRRVLAKGRKSRREAEEEFYRLMAAEGRGGVRPDSPLTVADVFNLFLASVKAAMEKGERAPSTYEGYLRHLSSAAERIGSTRVRDLTPFAVNRWCEAESLGWGPTTRNNAVTAVKAATRWAARQRLIDDDPIRDMAKATARKRALVLGDEQVRAILDVTAGTPFADLIAALWETGCRPAEVTTLTADLADPDAGLWRVRNKVRHKTGEEYRAVPLNPAMIEMTRRLKGRHPDGLLFRNARGRPWTRNAMACAFRRLRARLDFGPEATAYAIRHRYAIEGLRRGISSSDIAAAMGHRDARMVDTTYGHWDQQMERVRDTARRIRPGEVPPLSGPGEGEASGS